MALRATPSTQVVKENLLKPFTALFVAEAFGFGPASKLIAIAKLLRTLEGMTAVYLGHGSAYELCRTGPFDSVIYGDPTDLRRGAEIHLQLSSAKVIFTAMEFRPLPLAKSMGVRTVVFDSLFWMWPELPCDLNDVDLYLCQNFVGVSERASSLNHNVMIKIVPPITISKGLEWSRGESVVVNFGGMDNPYVTRAGVVGYATNVLKVMIPLFHQLGLKVDVCGRRWVMDELRSEFSGPTLSFQSLGLEEFVHRLKHVRCLITSPGLETLYEAFTLGVPTYILPAQNNSQIYQARQLRGEVQRLPGMQWEDVFEDDLLEPELGPAELTQQALQNAARLGATNSAGAALRDSLRRFLEQDRELVVLQRREQYNFVQRLRSSSDLGAKEWSGLAAFVKRTVCS